MTESCTDFISRKTFVSSANRYTNVSPSTTFGRSLMYITKSSGPRTLPWGIPLVTGALSERVFFIHTCCVRFVRKDFIHPSTFPVIPYWCILCKSLSWGTLSKAFMKSQYIASIVPPSSNILLHISRTCNICRVVDRAFMKPNCLSLYKLFAIICSCVASLMKLSMTLHSVGVKLTGL